MNKFKPEAIGKITEREGLFLLAVIAINFLIKAVPAAVLELGNDEVYYWTYALFPDWSHFDHPPLVGLTIQLFTLNLSLKSEFFMRLGALVLSSANIIILFYLVKRIFSGRAAYIAVILFISSFYFNIISGLFILPDTPQIFFILLALYYVLPSITIKDPSGKDKLNFIIFGLFTGLAFLSKYHSLFLWSGAGLYILFHNRVWLKKPAFYISILVTLILMIPVVYWNYRNHFISFTFHENRVGLLHNHIDLISFLQFNLGQFFYQNPVLFVIYTITLVKIFRNLKNGIKEINLFLLYSAIPLILVFVCLSLFRNTLPHWSGPAFICLIILSSEQLGDIYTRRKKRVVRALSAGFTLIALTLVLGTLQINRGIFDFKTNHNTLRPGQNDFTLDMYGWKQAREKFEKFLVKEGISENDHKNVAIISDNWFPAAHLDHYIAYPLDIKLVALGSIERIHKYYWINKCRDISKTDRIFYITDSRNYHDPEEFNAYFTRIIPEDTLTISRNHKIVKNIYIYDMIGFKPISADAFSHGL